MEGLLRILCALFLGVVLALLLLLIFSTIEKDYSSARFSVF